LKYINTSSISDPVKELRKLTDEEGFNDVFVFAPVPALIEQADGMLASDGCLNFFAGPSDPDFKVKFNFYNLHYQSTHIVGTSGGNNEDMLESLRYFEKGLDPAGLVTHIGGINAVIDATLNLPDIPGGKKLLYMHIDMPLTALTDFEKKGEHDTLFAGLDKICKSNKGLWSVEAEDYLLKELAK